MSRFAPLAAGLCALFALVGACYPDFSFRDDGDGGAGGQGGAEGGGSPTSTVSGSTATQGGGGAGPATSTAETSSSSTGVPDFPSVPCWNDGAGNFTECEQPNYCCYHVTTPSMDMCGTCDANETTYARLRCRAADDCDEGEVCCGRQYFVSTQSMAHFTCRDACATEERVACKDTEDCGGAACEPNEWLGTDPDYASLYRLCAE